MKSVNLREERLGQVNKNNYGSLMEVVEYNSATDIWVKFEKGNHVHTNWKAFCKGDVKSVYDKTVYGIGYIGEGVYKPYENGKPSPQYSTWTGMLERCYSDKLYKRYPTYMGCSVAEEWHNFQNFSKWYDENYYEVDDEKMELDKDILLKGNKTYSPDYCVFVPKRINLLFVKKDELRGDLPIGVCFYKRDKKYQANCKDEKGNNVYLGRYNTPEEAFEAYKKFKENIIKKVAEEYKDRIPKRLYEALINYEVEITD
ncbi:AP2 domain [[Flavobacterium] thermophilum]|nr:AP2 domain [[Flavobacterium] thermophilum]